MGNILSLDRNDRAEQDMDRLAYTYNYDGDGFLVNNRLMGVEDSESGNSVIAGDFIGTSAYVYDQIGNLTRDLSEEIDDIQWTVTGKVKKVIRVATSNKSDLEFDYDAMGNRVSKTEEMRDGSQLTGEKKITYYVRDASGNVMATYWETQNSGSDQQRLDELNIYGSSRLGMLKVNKNLLTLPENDLNSIGKMNLSYQIGRTYFELSNHLGNVLTVVTDRKFAVDDGGGGISYYTPDVVSATDYYPFGMQMSERSFSSDNYRYGFNGKEKDPEGMGGGGSTYDYGFRIYNPQIAKFLSMDPLCKSYPSLSPYQYASNNPIVNIDVDGLEGISATRPPQTIQFFALQDANGNWVKVSRYQNISLQSANQQDAINNTIQADRTIGGVPITARQAARLNNRVKPAPAGMVTDVHNNTTFTSFTKVTTQNDNNSVIANGAGNTSNTVSYNIAVPTGTSAVGQLTIQTDGGVGNRIQITDNTGNVLFDNGTKSYTTGLNTAENYETINLTPGSNLTVTVTPQVEGTTNDYWRITMTMTASVPLTTSTTGNTQTGWSGGLNPAGTAITNAVLTFIPTTNAVIGPDPVAGTTTDNQWDTVQSTTSTTTSTTTPATR